MSIAGNTITVTLRPPPPISPTTPTPPTTSTTSTTDSLPDSHSSFTSTPLTTLTNTHQVLYIQIPSRPTISTLHSLVQKLWGGWTALSVLPPPDLRTNAEKRYNVGALISHDHGDITYGHPAVIEHFLPSLSELRMYAAGKLTLQVRAATAYDPSTREAQIQLNHHHVVELCYLDPNEMLEQRRVELEAVFKAQDVARKTGKLAKKVKVMKKREDDGTGTTGNTGTKSFQGFKTKTKLSAKQIRMQAKKQQALQKRREEDEAKEDVDLLLLQSMQSPGMFYVVVCWVVGGTTIEVGPVSEKHVVADVAVLLERATGSYVRTMRMSFHGQLLLLHHMLGDIGLRANNRKNDMMYVTMISEEDMVEKIEDGVQGSEMEQSFVVSK